MLHLRSFEEQLVSRSQDSDIFGAALGVARPRGDAGIFWRSKRIFDVIVSIVGLPVVVVLALFVFALNPLLNPGPVFFTQTRMGRDRRQFRIYKFRSMLPPATACRGPEDPVEVDRITPLGAFLRRTRLDETPQFLNVLRGEMSIVGPRPDVLEHAQRYLETVPLYSRRCSVRPGITGFAQVTSGYAEGSSGAVEKARRDAIYVRRACWRLEVEILARTAIVMIAGTGSK